MSNLITSIDNVLAPTVAASIYGPVPANSQAVIQKFTATSEEATAARQLTIYKYPNGGPADGTTTIVYKLQIPAGQGIIDIPQLVNQVLEAGYSLWAVIDSGTTVRLNGSVLVVQ
jgi:hypothetical protein